MIASQSEIDRELREHDDVCMGRQIIARNRVIARKTILQRLRREGSYR